MSTDPSTKTIVLGFDALSFRYLDQFELPNLSALRSRGVETPLESTFPPWTGSAWPSLYTGADPSHHGVYSFFDYGDGYPDAADVVTRNDVHAPALWNYLSSRSVPSVVLNLPVTYPAERIEGALVPGYLAPESAPGHPEDVRAELDDEIGEYRIYARDELSIEDDDELLARYLELIESRERAAVHLLEQYDWEFAFVQVQKTDAVFHKLGTQEAARRVYEAADDLVGSVVETAEDPNVVVCSDHGMGPSTGYRIYVNEILREHGFVEPTTESTLPRLKEQKLQLMDPDGGPSTADGDVAGNGQDVDGERGDDEEPSGGRGAAVVSTAATALDRVGVSPGDVYAAAERAGVADALRRVLPAGAGTSLARTVDWSASAAYCRSGSELGVRVNLAGREPDGVVSPAEYDAVRQELVDVLSDVRTPDGKPAFEFVRRREDIYDGPHVEDACDVVFMPREMNNAVATHLLGRDFVPIDTHDHEREGVFVGAGPGFEDGATASDLSVADVAPIAMALLGQPVPERMTGSVPPGLLSGPVEQTPYGEVSYGTASEGVGEGDDEQVEERLSDLGYL